MSASCTLAWCFQSFREISHPCFVKMCLVWRPGTVCFCPPPASTLHGGDGSDSPLYWSCWKREGDRDVYLSLPVYLCRQVGGMRTGKRRGRACRQSCVLHLLPRALASSFSLSAKHAFSAPPEHGTTCPLAASALLFLAHSHSQVQNCMFRALKLSQACSTLAHY